MYDELERAAGARPGGGITLLGWIGISLLVFTLIGATGLFFAVRFVRTQVQEVVEQFEITEADEVSPLVARTVARTLGELNAAPQVDTDDMTRAVSRALAVTSRMDVIGEALSSRMARDIARGANVEVETTGEARADAGAQESGEEVEGFLRIRTSEGDITADLRADDGSGALIVRGVDGEVIVDLSADEDGGRLFIRGEGEIARIEAGSEAQGPPGWVPTARGDRFDIEPVISGHAGEASFGAVTWRSDEAPEAWIERYTERLESAGFEIRSEHRLDGSGDDSASVVAHDAATGRTILLAAGSEGEGTQVVLGWGEADEG
ncbi:MAG: hypothetical protein HKN71_08730 [Gemmatimonadetes bacterium]|nr:hypothetical protein [Gemmatimonadota bacterium]